jgi:hypothetical protein
MPPAKTLADTATQHVDLPASGPLLLGLFHRADGAIALIRDDSGRTLFVAPGTRIGDAVVTAIGETALFLARDGEEQVLSLPA